MERKGWPLNTTPGINCGYTLTMDMPLNKIARSVMLAGLSVSLLSGCVEDPYDYGNNGEEDNGGSTAPTGNIYKVYGDNADGWYNLAIYDEDSGITLVSDSGDAESLNIKVSPVEVGVEQGPRQVEIFDKASVMATSETSRDLSVQANEPNEDENIKGGTLQFYINPVTKTEGDAKIVVALPTAEGGRAEVDITSAYNSFLGAEHADFLEMGQQVKIPASCFTEQGVDFSNSETPFALESDSALKFELGNIRIRASTSGEKYVLPCASDSEVLKDDESEIYYRIKGDLPGDNCISNDAGTIYQCGWATTTQKVNNTSLKWPANGVTLAFDKMEAGQEGGLKFTVDSVKDEEGNKVFENKDLSQYMEEGVLSLDLDVTSYGANGRAITVQIETIQGYTASQVVELPRVGESGSGGFNFTTVEIPVRDLFTVENLQNPEKPDRRVDARTVQHVQTVVIKPVLADENDSLNDGMEFTVDNIKLLMKPAAN